MSGAERSVVVVDSHGVIAASLVIALRHAGFRSTRSFHPDAWELDGRSCPGAPARGDIVLLGLLLGDGRTALPLIEPLVGRGCTVVVMTVDQGLPLLGDCLRRGAQAVLDKDMSFEGLVGSLRVLMAGGTVMTDDERAALVESVEQHHAVGDALLRPFAALTARESVVLTGLVDGCAPKHIAHVEGISIFTVRGHIQRILRKLDVNSQREALAMAHRSGWRGLPPPSAPVRPPSAAFDRQAALTNQH